MSFILQSTPSANIGLWDIIDVLIAGYLVYLVYKLLKDSAAFNIFIGVLLVYILWWTVRAMNMSILSTILDQFVSVGVIILVIIFQPEIRRFLLVVGSTRLRSRLQEVEQFVKSGFKIADTEPDWIEPLSHAIQRLSERRMESILVIADKLNHDSYTQSGVPIRGDISKELLESILADDSPFHDGAVIIQNGKVISAGCSVPTKSIKEHSEYSLRERAAMGISEQTNDFCIVIDNAEGGLKYSVAGELSDFVEIDMIREKLVEHLNTTFAI